MPLNQNFDLAQGDVFAFSLTVSDYTGAPLSIAGAAVLMAANDSTGTQVFEIGTVTGDIVLTNPSAGQMLVTIPGSATAGVTFAAGTDAVYLKYDVRMTLAQNTYTLAWGMLTVHEPVAPCP